MTKKIFALQAAIALLAQTIPAFAAPPVFVNATVMPSGHSVVIPETAARVAENVFYLGSAQDPAGGGPVDGYAIVHYEKGAVQGVGAAKSGGPRCYTFLARGAKWRALESWLVNPTNTRGLPDPFVADTLASSIVKWEDAADGIVGNGIGTDILGAGSATTSLLSADTAAPDGRNEAYFADVADAGAIAITIVWYNRFTKTLVEWDQVYDDVDFDWSASGEPGKMDFENIATHELGHSVGLGDLYNSCAEETMYGYADFGETKKRDLNAGDIAGANALY